MATRAAIEEFLGHRRLALVRASRTTPVRGVPMDRALGTKGYDISVVYLDESGPGQTLKDLGGTMEGVIIAVPPEQSGQAVEQALDAGSPRVWLQQGSESQAAVALCHDVGVPVVDGACVLLYAQPVTSFCAFHRGVCRVFGLLAK